MRDELFHPPHAIASILIDFDFLFALLGAMLPENVRSFASG
jgi:hypothetical protein